MKYKNEYSQKEYEKKQELVKELNAIANGLFQFELVEDATNDSREYIRLTGDTPIQVSYSDYEKQYAIFLQYNLPYARYETYKKVSEKYKQPHNIGVLSIGKIKAWIEYLTLIYKELVIISNERVAMVKAFENEVMQHGARIGHKDFLGQFEGYILKNGIEFKFIVHDEAYISKDIEIHYKVSDTLENFLLLAANKYIEEK